MTCDNMICCSSLKIINKKMSQFLLSPLSISFHASSINNMGMNAKIIETSKSSTLSTNTAEMSAGVRVLNVQSPQKFLSDEGPCMYKF